MYHPYMNEIDIPITMTSKGTFTLPAQVRKDFGLNKKGDRLMLRYRPGNRSAELKALDTLKKTKVAIIADTSGYGTSSAKTAQEMLEKGRRQTGLCGAGRPQQDRPVRRNGQGARRRCRGLYLRQKTAAPNR